jgi:hypothetical protein
LEQSSKKFAGAHRASGDDDVPYAQAAQQRQPLAKKAKKRANNDDDDDNDDDEPIDYNAAAFDKDNDVYMRAKALAKAQQVAPINSREAKDARKAGTLCVSFSKKISSHSFV